jgi:hypothetical protein
MPREFTMIGRLALAAGMGTALAALSGCVSYANYPPLPKNVAVNNPNSPAMEEVTMAGLKWVVAKYPVVPEGEPFAINLPQGVKPGVYQHVADTVGNGAQPLTPENEHLPIYHVSEIRVRGDQANIWIDRPVVALGTTPQGTAVYQEVKLWLQGGLSPWHVVNAIDRTPGAAEIPPLNYYIAEPKNQPPRRSVEDESVYKPRPKSAPAQPAPEPAPPEGSDRPPPPGETPRM